jgi:4-hydroxybenzoate polyprenyltransferase
VTSTSDAISPRGVVACFFATFGISFAGAVVLGSQTAGWYVISLGVVFIAVSTVLDQIRSLSFEDEEGQR